jgi:hypothetical protein
MGKTPINYGQKTLFEKYTFTDILRLFSQINRKIFEISKTRNVHVVGSSLEELFCQKEYYTSVFQCFADKGWKITNIKKYNQHPNYFTTSDTYTIKINIDSLDNHRRMQITITVNTNDLLLYKNGLIDEPEYECEFWM